jgi:hypothetical protein
MTVGDRALTRLVRAEMRSGIAWSLIAAMLVCLVPIAQADLPPDRQADYLKTRITDAYGAKDWRKMLELLKQYHDLPVTFPSNFWYAEALAWYNLGDKTKAKASVKAFLGAEDRNSALYKNGLTLLASLESEEEATAKAEQEIRWVGTTKDGGRLGRIHVDGQEARIFGVTLECTYATSKEYHRIYSDHETNVQGALPTAEFPNDVPDLVKEKIRVTLHILTEASVKQFPKNLRPPWNGWFSWEDLEWHPFVKRSSDSLLLWNVSADQPRTHKHWTYYWLLKGQYWPIKGWARDISFEFRDAYQVSIPGFEPKQWLGLLSNKDCSFMRAGACDELLDRVERQFEQLQPFVCENSDYAEPPDLYQTFGKEKAKAQSEQSR